MLLFGLPRRIGEMTPVGPAPAMMPSAEGLFAGLIEVAGAATRLDRTVEARAAEPGFCRHATADKTPVGPGSEHRLIPKSAREMPSGHGPEGRRQMPTAIGVGRFSAVIVLVDPYDATWMPDVTWSDFLAQSGCSSRGRGRSEKAR
ncbi:hypothetical protein GCM10023080_030780 [Streptomyces pseudoechinosporeus]